MKVFDMAPVFLLFLGTVIALIPYLFWMTIGLNPHYTYSLSFIPIVVWLVGLFSFWLGVRALHFFYGRKDYGINGDEFNKIPQIDGGKFHIYWISCFVSLVALSIYQAHLHGGVPLFDFLSNNLSVSEVNDRQAESAYGLLGISTAFLFFCNGIILVAMIQCAAKSGTIFTWIFIVMFVLFLALLNVFSGKRQGLFMLFVYVFVATSVYNCIVHPRQSQPNLNYFSSLSFWGKLMMIVLFICILAIIFGYIGSIRSNNEFTPLAGFNQMFFYLELPLINFEVQCNEAEFGPGNWWWLGPLKSLVPYKTLTEMTDVLWFMPPRAEPGIGAGVWGEAHWYWGLPGVVFLGFIIGIICEYFYCNRYKNIGYMSVYIHLFWPLLSVNSYNHFLSMVFFVVPVALMIILLPVLVQKRSVDVLIKMRVT